MTIIPQTSKYLEKVAKKKESRLLQTYVLTEFLTAAQLLKFPINVSFWSNFEPVEISQKFNFLLTDYDFRKFFKASRACFSFEYCQETIFFEPKQIFWVSNLDSIPTLLCFDIFVCKQRKNYAKIKETIIINSWSFSSGSQFDSIFSAFQVNK